VSQVIKTLFRPRTLLVALGAGVALTIAILCVSGTTPLWNANPTATVYTSHRSTAYADGVVAGAFPAHQVVGREVNLHAHFQYDSVWPYYDELYLAGIREWRISPPLSTPQGDSGIAGQCKGVDDAPLLVREQATQRLYVQFPNADCSIDLHLTPLKTGVHTLTLEIYRRLMEGRDGQLLDAHSYSHPYKIPGSTLVRGVRLQWRVSVKGTRALR
jgi:hypothetical protein